MYGYVSKPAATVRVLFDDGRPPLQVPVVRAGATFPVNFYAAFYPQPGPPGEWVVDKVVALDLSGREVAHCRDGPSTTNTCGQG